MKKSSEKKPPRTKITSEKAMHGWPFRIAYFGIIAIFVATIVAMLYISYGYDEWCKFILNMGMTLMCISLCLLMYFNIRRTRKYYVHDFYRRLTIVLTACAIVVIPGICVYPGEPLSYMDTPEILAYIILYFLCLGASLFVGLSFLYLIVDNRGDFLWWVDENGKCGPAGRVRPQVLHYESTGSSVSHMSYGTSNKQQFKPLWEDMTADYYGKHGEFDNNDYDRAINEDIQQFRSGDKDFDAEYHFGWEHKLNYDSDDYPDEE